MASPAMRETTLTGDEAEGIRRMLDEPPASNRSPREMETEPAEWLLREGTEESTA